MTIVRATVDGPMPRTASQINGLAKRRAKAAVREGGKIMHDEIVRRARPSRRSGEYERGLQALPPVEVGDRIIGGVAATAPHSLLLEEGRGEVRPRAAKALRLAGIAVPRGVKFSMRSRPAAGKHYVELGAKASQREVKASARKWGRAIATDMRGRVR